MNDHHAISPDFIILSSDPPTSPPRGSNLNHHAPGKVKTQAKSARKEKPYAPPSRRHPKYEWPAQAILGEKRRQYLIEFLPATLTRAEYVFWSKREDFMFESEPDLTGSVWVVFLPTWQLKKHASKALVDRWNDQWEEVILPEEEL
ncbi:hypothetical protein P7C70_g7197, partial [Phenoliferia sp. Uapishka_3]